MWFIAPISFFIMLCGALFTAVIYASKMIVEPERGYNKRATPQKPIVTYPITSSITDLPEEKYTNVYSMSAKEYGMYLLSTGKHKRNILKNKIFYKR